MHILVKNTYKRCSRACTHFHTHTQTHTYSHQFWCHNHPFQRKAYCWATNTKVQWLYIDCSRDRYQATLISHSQRKSPHLWTVLCHNTLSISYSPPYSPVSYSKPNSSHPKHCFTHGSIWVPFPSVCYLVPCFDISLYGHSVCQYLSVEKL